MIYLEEIETLGTCSPISLSLLLFCRSISSGRHLDLSNISVFGAVQVSPCWILRIYLWDWHVYLLSGENPRCSQFNYCLFCATACAWKGFKRRKVFLHSDNWKRPVKWLKDWCFQIVVLEKTLESPLDSKQIKSGDPEENQPWLFPGRTDGEAEAPILWPPDVENWPIGKDPDAGKDWGQKEKGETEDEMVGWHHWLSGHEFEQTLGDSGRERSLACCSPLGLKELGMTLWLNGNNKWSDILLYVGLKLLSWRMYSDKSLSEKLLRKFECLSSYSISWSLRCYQRAKFLIPRHPILYHFTFTFHF